ncbi:uncharacterized protein FTJAE_11296 [Fusarium tjaetaba]|uniref:Uncharacterized protein n=1 Tax=Fusarium tjaetaba TaxID=1567544 RepID=A0A8H5QUI8_9HYPO|nr:uncharacterized protein FTJAE_11296 [Fusarium tjaetaba]KAF5621405.1 hypothetical protein FTJAE_11296 [Fusarium tjaetaba]
MTVNFLALDFNFVLGTSDSDSTAAEGIQTAIVGDVSYLLRLNVDCARENLDDDDISARGTTCRSNRPFQNINFFQESRQLCTDISAILRSHSRIDAKSLDELNLTEPCELLVLDLPASQATGEFMPSLAWPIM